MRTNRFAWLASLILGLSLTLTGCKVGGDGGDGGDDNGGGDAPDARVGGGTPDAGQPQGCPPSVEDFETDVFDVAFNSTFGCVGCHGGGAGGFTLTADNMAANLTAATNKAKKLDGTLPVLLTKPSGTSPDGHSGGKKYEVGSVQYQALEKFVGQVTGTDCPGS